MIAVTVRQLIHKPEFGDGVAWAFGLSVVGVLVGLLWRRVWRRPAPIAGLIVAAAFGLAFHFAVGIPTNVERGLWLLAAAGVVAGFLAALWHPLIIVGIGLALPGATLLTRDTGLLVHPHWVKTLVVATVVVGGTLVADFDRRYRDRGWAPAMFAISAVGLYFTVPDTERAMLLLGAALPVVLLGWPFPLASLGVVGAYPCVGALAWVAAFDGRGRLSAIVAGVACLGAVRSRADRPGDSAQRTGRARRAPTPMVDRDRPRYRAAGIRCGRRPRRGQAEHRERGGRHRGGGTGCRGGAPRARWPRGPRRCLISRSASITTTTSPRFSRCCRHRSDGCPTISTRASSRGSTSRTHSVARRRGSRSTANASSAFASSCGGSSSAPDRSSERCARSTPRHIPITRVAGSSRGSRSTRSKALRGEGVGFVFNTPNDQSRPGYLKMDWKLVERLPVLARPRALLVARRCPGPDFGRRAVPAGARAAPLSRPGWPGDAFDPGDGVFLVRPPTPALRPSWRVPASSLGPFPRPSLVGASMRQIAASVWPAARTETVAPFRVSMRQTKSTRLPPSAPGQPPAWHFHSPVPRLNEQLGCCSWPPAWNGQVMRTWSPAPIGARP